jgi:hypothetical protein
MIDGLLSSTQVPPTNLELVQLVHERKLISLQVKHVGLHLTHY